MRKIFVSMALFLCLFLPAVAQAWEAIVTYIKDGDSFVVERPDGERVEIRLLGVDCPERRTDKVGIDLYIPGRDRLFV